MTNVVFIRYAIFLSSIHVCLGEYEFVVATYNIWNVMFNWEIRQLRIAQLVALDYIPMLLMYNPSCSWLVKSHLNSWSRLFTPKFWAGGGTYECHLLFCDVDGVAVPLWGGGDTSTLHTVIKLV